MRHLIFGPPGTGKTTRLLDVVDARLQAGVKPVDIGYISYTKKAVQEAVWRAKKKFGLCEDDLRHFRTLHSMAFRALGMTTERMLGKKHLAEFGDLVGHDFTDNRYQIEDGLPQCGGRQGDLLLSLVQLARAKQLHISTIWRMYQPACTLAELTQFDAAYAAYRKEASIYDYTDLLEAGVASAEFPQFDTLIIDEAQDLYPLQWAVIEKLMTKAKAVWIGGDPDQAIYEWAGADPSYLLALYRSGKWRAEQLEQSYRLPATVHDVALTVIRRCDYSYPKTYRPRNARGSVNFINYWPDLEFDNGQSWYLLGRNGYLLNDFKEFLTAQGLAFTYRHARAVNSAEVAGILAWERGRRGELIPYDDCMKIYDYMISGRQIKRGGKISLTNAPQRDYTLAELKTEYGLLTLAPWFESLIKIPEQRRDYYRAMLRRGQRLTSAPLLHIDTIHGVKGGEAENVLLLTDMAGQSFRGYQEHADAEHRVFYVGITRAKQNLHIVSPQGTYFYTV